jgi:type VI secretion system protein ImpA
LKDARSAARAAERKADSEGGPEVQSVEWDTILELAPQLLTTGGKDLEVVAWLIEALVRVNGFAGLRDGCLLTQGMVDRYWDTFYSLQDEEGMLTRLAPIAGLNGVEGEGTLIQPLRKVPITVGDEFGPYSVYHFEQANALAQIPDAAARAKREAAGAVSLEKFKKAVAAGGGAFYVNLLEDLDGASKAFDAMTKAFDAKAGDATPPSSNIHDLLATITDTTRSISKELVARMVTAPSVKAEPQAADGEAPAKANGTALSNGAPHDREDALRHLLTVADYFRQSEPHSPISVQLEEVVRRARLPFSELLAELVPDAAAWRSALTNAGIKPPPPPAATK